MSESKPTVIRYVGPSDEVYAVDLAAYVKRGKTVEVPTKALAKALLAQEGTWEAVDDDPKGDRRHDDHKTPTGAAQIKTED